jgi:hypothetical protein
MQKTKKPSVVIDPPTSNDKIPHQKTSSPANQQLNLSSDQLSDPPVVEKNGTNNWQLPVTMSQEFSTLIDQGCTLDKQGYPLFPNRSTTYVLPIGTDIENFGKVGFSQTSNHKSRSGGLWKVNCVTCLGVLHCNWEECHYTGPPPTGQGKIDELLSQ